MCLNHSNKLLIKEIVELPNYIIENIQDEIGTFTIEYIKWLKHFYINYNSKHKFVECKQYDFDNYFTSFNHFWETWVLFLSNRNIDFVKSSEILIDLDDFYTIFENYKEDFFASYHIEYRLKRLFNKFISIDILRYILDNTCFYKEFKYQFRNINIKLSIFYTKVIDIPIHQIIEKINKMIWLAKRDTIQPFLLEIDIWLTHFTKQLSDKKNPFIGVKNVNSGCTMTNGSSANIMIWRKEECEKVLIHELIHAFQLDHTDVNYESIDKLILDNFNIPPSPFLNIFEAFTEIWALILNSAFNCEFSIKQTVWRLKVEYLYSLMVMSRILNYYGYSKFHEEFLIPHSQVKSRFDQGTSVFSYYILKSLIFSNLDFYINYCKDRHLFYSSGLSKPLSVYNIVKNIIKQTKSNQLDVTINRLIKIISDKLDSYSLRMTLLTY